MCVFIFSTILSGIFLILRRTKILTYMYIGFHADYPLFLSDFNGGWIFSMDFRKIFKYKLPWNKVFQEDGRTDRHTDMATLTIASRDFANGPKNCNLKYVLNNSKITVFRKWEKLKTNEKWRMNGQNNEVVDTRTCRLSSLEVTFEAQEVGINRKHRPNLN